MVKSLIELVMSSKGMQERLAADPGAIGELPADLSGPLIKLQEALKKKEDKKALNKYLLSWDGMIADSCKTLGHVQEVQKKWETLEQNLVLSEIQLKTALSQGERVAIEEALAIFRNFDKKARKATEVIAKYDKMWLEAYKVASHLQKTSKIEDFVDAETLKRNLKRMGEIRVHMLNIKAAAEVYLKTFNALAPKYDAALKKLKVES